MKKTVQDLFDEEVVTDPSLVGLGRDWRIRYWHPTYEELVTIGGEQVVASADIGSYQGDLLFLVKNSDGQFAFVEVGYGSCSGCDWLQGNEGDIPALQGMADSLNPSEEDYKSAIDMLAWVMDRDWKDHYYYQDEDAKGFVTDMIQLLQKEIEG